MSAACLDIKVGDPTPGEATDAADILITTHRFQGGNPWPARLFRVNRLSLFKRASW